MIWILLSDWLATLLAMVNRRLFGVDSSVGRSRLSLSSSSLRLFGSFPFGGRGGLLGEIMAGSAGFAGVVLVFAIVVVSSSDVNCCSINIMSFEMIIIVGCI